jgi:hypothetical protein
MDTLREDQYTFFLSYLMQFFLEWEMFRSNVEKIKTGILFSVTPPQKIIPFVR